MCNQCLPGSNCQLIPRTPEEFQPSKNAFRCRSTKPASIRCDREDTEALRRFFCILQPLKNQRKQFELRTSFLHQRRARTFDLDSMTDRSKRGRHRSVLQFYKNATSALRSNQNGFRPAPCNHINVQALL